MSHFRSGMMMGFWNYASSGSTDVKQAELIEGISNEVLAFVFTAFVGIVSVTSLMYKCFARAVNPQLHPDSMEHVEMTRSARNMDGGENSSRTQGAFGRLNSESCPICLVPFRNADPDSSSMPGLAVETNCGHLFCSECLLRFHEVSTVISALNCPVCRQQVTLLMWDRSTPLDRLSEQQRRQVSSIQTYNRRFSGQPRSLIDILRDMPILIRHFIRNLFSVTGIRLLFRFRSFVFISTCLIYIILPLDLLPEALFGILGLVDDIFIILCAITWISIQYRNQILNDGH